MITESLITPDAVLADLSVGSKKQLLEEISKRAGSILGIKDRKIFRALIDREKLGTTGVGKGVAIPHAKLPDIEKSQALFVQLKEPIDYESVDDKPVDLVFVLLAPEKESAHPLKELSQITKLMRDEQLCGKLRESGNPDIVYSLIASPGTRNAA